MRELFVATEKQISKSGSKLFCWNPRGHILAVATFQASASQSKVVLYDRYGEQTNQVSISDSEQREFDNLGQARTISHIEWDSLGEKIAIKCKNSSNITIWDVSTGEVHKVDIGVKHNVTFITWHLSKPILAIGTDKGTLVLYNDDRKQRVVLVGYHSKALTCSAWSGEGFLALGSVDNQVSIMKPKVGTEEGEDNQLNKMALKGEPVAIDFAPISKKGSSKLASQVVRLSINVNRRSLYLLDINKDEDKDTTSVPKHTEIVLDENYGRLSVHVWYREQFIVVGTDTGYIVILSSTSEYKLVHPFRFFRDPIADMSISNNCSLDMISVGDSKGENVPDKGGKGSRYVLACCGNRNVLILDITKPSAAVEIMSHSLTSNVERRGNKASDSPPRGAGQRRGSLHRWAAGPGGEAGGRENSNCEYLCWTDDGQILSVSSQDGSVHSLLVSLPIVGCAYQSNIAYLTSLAEVSIVDINEAENEANFQSTMGGDVSKDPQDATQSQSLMSCSIMSNVKTDIEPSICALGPYHLAVGLNNECWFYHVNQEQSQTHFAHFDYITSIESIHLNAKHAAVLSEGQIHLHRIDVGGMQELDVDIHKIDKNEVIISGSNGDITSTAMTENFLIAGTRSGSICYWLVNDPSSGASWDDDFYSGLDGVSQSTLVAPPQINEYRHGHNQDDSTPSRASTINSAMVDDNYDDAYQTKFVSNSQYAVTKIVPNASGTHLLFSDARRRIFFFNAVNDQVFTVMPPAGTNFVFEQEADKDLGDQMRASKLVTTVPRILWDTDDPNVFIVFTERTHGESLQVFGSKHQAVSESNNNGFIAVYVYVPTSTSGSEIKLAGMHPLRKLPGKPLMLSKGYLIFLTGSFNLERLLLDTHKHIMAKYSLQQLENSKRNNTLIATSANANKHDRLVRDEFDQHLSLYHMEEAKEIATLSRDHGLWVSFASQALETLNINMAILGYRMAGDTSKASALSRLRHVEDKHLLAGHAVLILGEEYNKSDRSVVEIAETYLFRSSEPKAALEMYIDLKNWERALELADNVSASDMEKADINKQYAGTLELRGEYQAARRAYDIAIELYNRCMPKMKNSKFDGISGLSDDYLEDTLHNQFGSEMGDYGNTVRFEPGNNAAEGEEESPAEITDQIKTCKGGIARCIIHLGDVETGVQIALELAQEEESAFNTDKTGYKRKMDMFQDFAIILEEAGHVIEAAEMHHVCGNVEQAATLFVKSKQFARAKPLMTQVTAPSLHQVFAKAMELKGDYQVALSSYQRANDHQSLVRLYLGSSNIKNPHKGFAIVRQTRSLESAKLALQYCLDKGDHEGQVEMLVILGRIVQALELAVVHNTVDFLVENIKNSEAEPQIYLQIAKYYEQNSQFFKAGRMYETCCKSASLRPSLAEHLVPSGDFYSEESGNGTIISEFIDACNNSAIQFYLKDGTSEAIDSAIALVGRVRSSSLIAQVVDWLADQTESTSSAASKEGARHLFELHIALGDLVRAAHVACVLARQEQDMGNYKLAHEQVHHAYCELRGELTKEKLSDEDGKSAEASNDKLENENPNNRQITKKKKGSPIQVKKASGDNVLSELLRQLVILHSYVLVKTQVKMGDHLSAARLLIRVSKHISKFPAHIVPILTSTVIECQRAGLKWAAFEHASILMRDPDYRSQIAPTYKRKIENIIRKPDPALKMARAKGQDGEESSKTYEDPKEMLVPCPFCGYIGSEYDLQCHNCKKVIPFCSASGKRMMATDWSKCQNCKFPFNCQQMKQLIDKGETRCQLCHYTLSREALNPIPFTKDLMTV